VEGGVGAYGESLTADLRLRAWQAVGAISTDVGIRTAWEKTKTKDSAVEWNSLRDPLGRSMWLMFQAIATSSTKCSVVDS